MKPYNEMTAPNSKIFCHIRKVSITVARQNSPHLIKRIEALKNRNGNAIKFISIFGYDDFFFDTGLQYKVLKKLTKEAREYILQSIS